MADGVSASPLAEVGAQIAVKSCMEYFSEFRYSPFLSEEGMRDILCDAFNYALRRVLESDKEEEKIPYSKYTTLHLVIYGGRIGLHWGQVGDGAVLLLDRSGRWTRLGKSMKHEEGDGPVTLQDGPDYWRFGSMDARKLEAILMTTDGLGEVLELAEPDVRGDMLRLLTCPDAEGDAADAYYRELFFGDSRTNEARDAIQGIRSVTDDITLLTIRGLEHPVTTDAGGPEDDPSNKGDRDEDNVPSPMDTLAKVGKAIKPWLKKVKPMEKLDSLLGHFRGK